MLTNWNFLIKTWDYKKKKKVDGQLFYLNVDSYFSLNHFHIHVFSSQVAHKHFKARDISFSCFVSSHHWTLWKYIRTNQMRKAKALYFELTVVRKSTTVTWVSTDWKESKGVGKFYSGKKGRLHMPCLEALGMGKLKSGN